MAIVFDKVRKKYYIEYYLRTDDKVKKIKIRNKDWNADFSKRRLKQIELEVIENDKNTRLEEYHRANSDKFIDVVNAYINERFSTRKEQTAYNDKIFINKYMLSCFKKNSPVDKALNMQSVEKFKKYLFSSNLSDQRINFGYLILRGIIDYAAEREMLSFNTAAKLKLLIKNIKENKTLKEDTNFWTVEEYEKFIKTFEENSKWRLLFETTYWGALRIGETLGLKFKDINYKNKTISIKRQLDRTGKETTTKNASSNNTVVLPTFLIDKLYNYEKESFANQDDYVFFIKHTSRTSIKRVMDEHIKLAGVHHLTKHGLRHSMASRMINQGVNILVVSKHLRHASTQQTLNTYAHLFPNLNKDIIDKLV